MALADEHDLINEAALEAGPSSLAWEPMNQRRVLRLSLPIIGENLLQTAVGAVDTLLVSRLGDSAIAGVGIGVEVVFFIIAILSAVSIGATVLVAQAVGAKDQKRGQRSHPPGDQLGLADRDPAVDRRFFSGRIDRARLAVPNQPWPTTARATWR